MSKERQRRRAEREAAAARAAEARAAAAERRARQRARRDRLTGWVPRGSTGRQTGLLADRKRKQWVSVALLLVVLNLVVFGLSREPGLSALLLVASLLGAPIVHLMLFRRT